MLGADGVPAQLLPLASGFQLPLGVCGLVSGGSW